VLAFICSSESFCWFSRSCTDVRLFVCRKLLWTSSFRKTGRRISAGARWRPLGAIPLGTTHPGTSAVEDPFRAILPGCHHHSDHHHRPNTARLTTGSLTNGLFVHHPTPSATAADLLIHQHTEDTQVRHTRPNTHAADTLRTLTCLHFR